MTKLGTGELSVRSADENAVDAPDVTFDEELASYETLVAIAEELRPAAPRKRMPTRIYGDRLSNAPGSTSPRTAKQLDVQPKLQVAEAAAGRDTLAAIEYELAPHLMAPDISVSEEVAEKDTLVAIQQELGGASWTALDALEINEMVTFVVRGEAKQLASAEARRELVQRSLLGRLPVRSAEEVDRVDGTPGTTRGTRLVRVWCRITR